MLNHSLERHRGKAAEEPIDKFMTGKDITPEILAAFNKAAEAQADYWNALGEFEGQLGRDLDGMDSGELSPYEDTDEGRNALAEYLNTFDGSEGDEENE
jgi:hypothetical protein